MKLKDLEAQVLERLEGQELERVLNARALRAQALEDAFNKSISGLEIRTTKEYGLGTLFGLLDRPPYIKVESGKEIRLSTARNFFEGVYNDLSEGLFRDDSIPTFSNATEKFIFDEAVKYTRRVQREWRAERQSKA
ncbi:MAG: hypothetical protein AABY26_02845 [Nanoarchaeota archaeon]